MRILVIYYKPFFPINSGDKNVIASHIEELSKFADVDLLCFGSSAESNATLPGLHNYIYLRYSNLQKLISLLRYFSWKKPLQCALYSLPVVRKWIKEHSCEYDIIYPHFFRSFTLVENLHTRIILHLHDALSLNYSRAIRTNISFWRQLIYRYEIPRLKKYEISCIHHAEHTFTVSTSDKTYFVANGAEQKKISHIPITVSTHLFTTNKPIKPKQICFFGNMSYIANSDAVEWFVNEVFPHLPDDITFEIIGSSPPERIEKLASPRITVTGFVENPYELIAESALMVAPLRIASGVQVKILEAMALGKPIVASTVCTQALNAENGKHFLLADTPEDFVTKITSLLTAPNNAKIIGDNARTFCAQHHTVLDIRPYFLQHRE